MLTDEIAIAQTRKWVQDVVVGCNFCPFAGRELLKNTIRYTLVRGDDLEHCLESVKAECERLIANADIETTLLLFPDGFIDFEEYLDLVDLAERLVVLENYEGVFQVASFHPDYLFGGSHNDDPANFTNRSIMPMLHILREASVTKAVENHPNVDDIPNQNISFAQAKGLEYMRKLRSACANILPIFLILLGANTAQAQEAHSNLRRGNAAYTAEKYTEAEENYRKGLEKEPNSLKSAYNLGNSLFYQKRYDESVKQYEKALPQGKTNAEKSQILYNMGNALLAQNKFKESANAFKNAIRENPNNKEAQYNLNIAFKKIKQQQKNKQVNDQKGDKKPPPSDKNKESDKKDAANSSPNEPQQAQQTSEEQQGKPQNGTDGGVGEQSNAQAREILRIMDNEEKKVQTKLHKYKGARPKNRKDW